MKRQRKNFLGILGLFLVTAMTTYAYSLPTKDTSATSGEVTLSVTVIGNDGSIVSGEEKTEKSTIDVTVDLVANKKTVVLIINKDTDQRFTIGTYEDVTERRTETITLDLEEYGGEGEYEVLAQTFDEEEEIFSEYKLEVEFEIPIDVPSTGLFSKGLNFAESDYLIAGILAFTFITITMLIFRKKQSKE